MKRLLLWCCLMITLLSGATAKAPSRIQLALLLDTSGSMDGLLKQAKSQLWHIVSTMSAAKKNGQPTLLELALYEYGNSGIPVTSGYVRQLCAFTDDLDLVSEKLFALTTNGGEEYCPTAIITSVNDLAWSKDVADLHLIVIAGNEAFQQGSLTSEEACKSATTKDIAITTIFCGQTQEGRTLGWDLSKGCKGGAYFAINSDGPIEEIATPYDTSIVRLNNALNTTYTGYGSLGLEKKVRQDVQDANASGMGASAFVERSVAKASGAYSNSTWDLVDLYNSDKETFKKLEARDLPEQLRTKSLSEREAIVKDLQNKRGVLQRDIQQLNEKRMSFIRIEEKRLASRPQTIGSGIITSLRALAEARQFSFAS
ncbi:MAG: hypothetical protein SGJ05_04710 [bacterium]|nr:hypothetical protein [bacterium]